MGRVLVARDEKLGRRVAVKVVTAAHDPGRVQRFEQEARTAGSLEHPNVLAVYDLGEQDGVPFLVTELLEGHTLRTVIDGPRLPPSQVQGLAVQLAHGLAAAHARGIVHRDLKPENLFLTEQGVLKILDFGIAKLAPRAESVERATDTGAIVGTVGYMSPEQVRGHAVDPRADLFAFGAILYEMLAGRRAFDRISRLETASAILNDEPPPLPQGVPRALRKIVRRCLAKNPEDRYASAVELETALRMPGRQPRRRLLDVALLALAIGITLALSTSPELRDWVARVRGRPGPAVEQLAVLPFRTVGGGADGEAFAAGMVEMLNNKLRQLEQFQDALRVVSGNEVVRGGVNTAREARRAFGAALALTGTLRWSDDHLTVTSELVQTG